MIREMNGDIAQEIENVFMDYSEVILFLLGLSAGSFLSVLSFRYTRGEWLFKKDIFIGRSHCMSCKTTLSALELIPLVSFLIQRGKCRSCGVRFSFIYPLLELIAGFMFTAIPRLVFVMYNISFLSIQDIPLTWYYLLTTVYIIVALILLFIAIIDIRFQIIPDGSVIAIALLGIGAFFIQQYTYLADVFTTSFIGHYAFLFGFVEPLWMNRLIGSFVGILFLGSIVVISRGKGMGMGDVKLAGALGILIGWPDIILALFLAFITGSIWSILLMIRGTKGLKSYVPFGPFIVLGTFLIIFLGNELLQWYFTLFPG